MSLRVSLVGNTQENVGLSVYVIRINGFMVATERLGAAARLLDVAGAFGGSRDRRSRAVAAASAFRPALRVGEREVEARLVQPRIDGQRPGQRLDRGGQIAFRGLQQAEVRDDGRVVRLDSPRFGERPLRAGEIAALTEAGREPEMDVRGREPGRGGGMKRRLRPRAIAGLQARVAEPQLRLRRCADRRGRSPRAPPEARTPIARPTSPARSARPPPGDPWDRDETLRTVGCGLRSRSCSRARAGAAPPRRRGAAVALSESVE